MGLTPLVAEAGDLICIPFGARVPFILRPTDDYYLLVQECYFHGVMEGQAMGWSDTTGLEFKIR